jgi:[acyl-carrier-protein] S-malonyltransferase
VAWVFPGQGSQVVGMGGELSSEAARETFEIAERVLGWDVRALCLEGPEGRLGSTRFAQPAIVTLEVAIARSLQAQGIAPDLVAGHSVGEFAAMVASRAVGFEDALSAVAARAEAMARAGLTRPGGMAAVIGLGSDRIAAICEGVEGVIGIANLNAPGQIVVSGEESALAEAAARARAQGARRVVRLRVSVAAHSPLMEGAGHAVAEAVSSASWSSPEVPFVSGASGRIHRKGADLAGLLVDGVTRPVRWLDCVRTMLAEGVGTFLEVGPGAVLSGLVRRIDPEARTVTVGDDAAIAEIADEPRPAGARADG